MELLKSPVWWLKWASTALLIAGATSTAFGITPINATFFLWGSVGWTVVGVAWKDGAIIAVNGVCAAIYITGWLFPGLIG